MPRTPTLVTVDPRGRTLTIDWTTPSGVRPSTYTAENGSTTHLLPLSISSRTDFWFERGGSYTLSALLSGTEVASQFGTTRTVSVPSRDSKILVDVGADLEELLAGLVGGVNLASDLTFNAPTYSAGALLGGNVDATSFEVNQSYTQTANAASADALGVGFIMDWDPTTNYAGGTYGPNLQGGFFGPSGMFQAQGTATIANDQGAGPVAANINAIAFADQMYLKNNSSSTRKIASSHCFMSSRVWAADGGAVTINENDYSKGNSGYVSDLIYMCGSSGTLTASETYGFYDAPSVLGGATVTTRVGFNAEDIDDNNVGSPYLADVIGPIFGLASPVAGQGTVTNNIGLRVPRMTRGTNNWGFSIDTPSRMYTDTVTFTANPPAMITANGTHTMNVSSGQYASGIVISPLVKWQQSPGALGGWSGAVVSSATFQATANSTSIMGIGVCNAVTSVLDASTFTGITATALICYQAGPITTRSGGGGLTATSIVGFDGNANVGAGTTVTTLKHFMANDVTNNGTITNFYGLDIGGLTKGGTKNRAIRIAASASGTAIEMGLQTNNETSTTNLPASTGAIYFKGGLFVLAYNDAGTLRYTSTPMTGTTNPGVWTHGTGAP